MDEKKKILIWGLGKEYNHFQNIINSKEILGKGIKNNKEYEIVAYCDKRKMAFQNYINPEDVFNLNPDLVITSKFLKAEISAIYKDKGMDLSVQSFEEFIDNRLSVDCKSVGNGMGMERYLRAIEDKTSIKVKNIFEIGANYGQDSEYCRLVFGLQPSSIYTFEANPNCSERIAQRYQFNNYNFAVSNKNTFVTLHMVPNNAPNSGISTIADYEYAREYPKVRVECIRMDKFLESHLEITNISLLKIDVEGVNYEVLEGFGEQLHKVQSIQIEAEHVSGFRGHRLFLDIAKLLTQNNYELVDYVLHDKNKQSDSLWVKKDYIIRGV